MKGFIYSQLHVYLRKVKTARNSFIFLHGIGSSLNSHAHFNHHYPQMNYGALDFPGHGQSPTNSLLPMNLNFYSECAIHLVRQSGFYKPFLIGHSMGGAIAVLSALELKQEIGGLILINPFNPKIFANGWNFINFLSNKNKINPDAVYQLFFHNLNLVKQFSYFRKAVENDFLHFKLHNRLFMRLLFDMIGYFSIQQLKKAYAKLPLIRDILVIFGTDDRIINPFVSAEFIKEVAPHAHLAFINHCGHSPYHEKFATYCSLIEEFTTRFWHAEQVAMYQLNALAAAISQQQIHAFSPMMG